MLIKMLKTEKGSRDGIRVETFKAGWVGEIPEKLAKVFISIASAELHELDSVNPIELDQEIVESAPQVKEKIIPLGAEKEPKEEPKEKKNKPKRKKY